MSDQQAFCDLEKAVLEVQSLGHVLASVPPGSEAPFEHVQQLLGMAGLRLALAWDAFVASRLVGGDA